jgi:limonene 1,2-monooxygenase
MFGMGPGLLTSDAIMLGIDPMKQRDRMIEAIDIILALFRGETVTKKSEWFNLENARLHLLPFTRPHPEMAVASTITPSGGRAAGKYGFGMLCVAATQSDGFDVLATNWRVACDIARENGRTMDPSVLRLVGPMHIAETREKARANCAFGLASWMDYFNKINPARLADVKGMDPVDAINETRRGVIGTPDDAIAMIERLYAKQGTFGAFLHLAHNWADFEPTKKSYELYARYVVPHFRKANVNRVASLDWVNENVGEFTQLQQGAAAAMFAKHKAERGK